MSGQAMLRDASWFNRANTRSIKAYHADNGEEFAMCSNRIPLSEYTARDLAEVRPGLRCGRNGCKQAFVLAAGETPEP